MSQKQFQATIRREDKSVYLELPFDPSEVWGPKERHYLRGTVNGCTIRALLDMSYRPARITFGAAWLRDNPLPEGEVAVELEPEGPQAGNIADDISAALDSNPEAKAFFESLATFYRKNYIRWIESAKRPETRQNRIVETVRLLEQGLKQRP